MNLINKKNRMRRAKITQLSKLENASGKKEQK